MASATFLLKTGTFVVVSSIGLCSCFLTMFQFAVFLFKNGFYFDQSNPTSSQHGQTRDGASSIRLLQDLLLIAIFILQHSLMACRLWKDFLQWLGFQVVERSLYILATCAALQVMMFYWRPIFQDTLLWFVDTNSRLVWTTFSIISFLGWLCVIGVALVIDYAELVGLKQVYYFALGLEPPIQMKSREYQRLFKNFRHPVLTGLLIIFWAVPVMSVGRFLLASCLTIYTFFGHSLDMRDYDYIRLQHQLKKVTLGSPQVSRSPRAWSVSYG